MTHEVISAGNKRVLKFDCKNCERDPSILRTPACMGDVIQGLEKHVDIDKISLVGKYVQEYGKKDLVWLKEFTGGLENSRYLILKSLNLDGCAECRGERRSRANEIWNRLKSEPAKGMAELRYMKKEFEEKSQRGPKKCKRCRRNYLDNGIGPALECLLETRLMDELESRGEGLKKCENLFVPFIRPRFLRSKLKLQPPEGAELVDAYEIDGSKIRIYHSTERLEYMYFIIPPEYRLPPNQVEILQAVRQKLLDHRGSLNPMLVRREIEKRSRSFIMDTAIERGVDLKNEKIEELSKSLSKFTAGLGIVESLLADPRIQDIYVDAPIGENPIHIYHQEFEECLTNIFLTPENAQILASRLRDISGRPFSEAHPTLDLNLGNVRIAGIQKPFSPEGMALAIRKHKSTPWTLPLFVSKDFLTPKAGGLLSLLVDSQASVLITGSRGAGKTSLLGALMLELPPKYRILCLEDTSELPVEDLRSLGYKVQRLQVRPSSSDSEIEMCAEDAVRAALRLGESVLIMGEVRGPETKSLYEAMRIGAAGNSVMGTIHGSSTEEVFERVVYDLGIPPSSFKATDAIAVASPIRLKGSVNRIRRLTQISEVKRSWREDPVNEDGFTDLMNYDPEDDKLRTSPRLEKEESCLLKSISRKWSMDIHEVEKNWEVRSKIQESLVKRAYSCKKPELLEAENVIQSNLTFHRLLEEEFQRRNVDYDGVFLRWREWLSEASR